MTAYFHFMFTSLDLEEIQFVPSANITSIQVFEPNDTKVNSLVSEFNFKNMIKQQPLYKYLPVGYI